MIRKPVVAGMFYPDNKEKLLETIEKSFSECGKPFDKKDNEVIGVISPHAGYQFSGKGQAYCYKEIGESSADVYVILGTSHMGFEKAAIDIEDFETPLGIVPVDKEFSEALVSKKVVVNNNYPHVREHSIEVQLPFLQYVDSSCKIVPIVVGSECDYEKLGKAIADVSKELNKKVIIICSSDFTHYGVNYTFVPFKDNIKENLTKMDMGAIKWIKKLDAWSFLDYVKESKATICGGVAIAVFIVACKEMKGNKLELLNYFSSGDVSNDWTNSVSYASILVR